MRTDYKPRIAELFCVLASAYETYNYDRLRSVYLLPCQLNWAGNTSIITDNKSFITQFETVWSSLRSANFRRFKCERGSMHLLSDNQALACVQWNLLNAKEELIRSVASTYILVFGSSGWKVSCDVVHEVPKYVQLPEKLTIVI